MNKLLRFIAFYTAFSCFGYQSAISNELSSKPEINTEHCIKSLEEIDAVVNHALEMFNVPGAAIGVIVDNQIVLARGYGSRKAAQNFPVTENTLFPIASCTKAFTALILSQLVEEGKISWDAPVIQYIPELRLFNQELTSQVTIRDLAAHRTGISRHDPIWVFSDVPKLDVIRILQHFEPANKLRESFQYNNFMYALAGIVIERMTGQTWEEAVLSRIFIPLGMIDSNTSLEQLHRSSNFSDPHAEIDGTIQTIPFHPLATLNPGGGINSTVSDMLKWIQLQLSDGTAFDYSFVKKETLQETHTIQMPFPTESRKENAKIKQLGYGLGWMIIAYRGHLLIQHGGDINGFASDVTLLPQEKIGIVILTNSTSDGHYVISSIRNMILDLFLNAKDTNWMIKAHANRVKAKQALHEIKEDNQESNSSRSLQDYAGSYEHPAYGVVQIYIEKNQLIASYKQATTALTYQYEDIFKGQFRQLLIYGINPFVNFSFFTNSFGEIDELHIPFEGFRAAKPVVFKRKKDNDQ